MKTTKELLSGKDSTWAIIDEKGNKIQSGFRNKTCATQNISRLRLNKHEKLRVIEE